MRIIIPDTTKNLLLAGAALFLGTFHTYLFLDEMVGLNYPLFIIAALVCGLGLSHVFHRSVTRDSFVLMGLAVFFSAMVFVRESELLTFFNILGSILLLFIAINLFSGKKLREYLVSDFLKAATLPFRCIGPFFETAPALFTLRNFAIHNKNTKEIVRGTIMAAVLLSLFTWLLAGADAHFAHFFNTFFSFSLDENAIPYIIRTVFIAAFFIGAFGFMFRTHERSTTPSPAHVRNLGLIETSIVLGAINILFLTFIVLQISTLFGGETHHDVNI